MVKFATSKYNVALKGTRKVIEYYGYKTKKKAEEIAKRMSEITGVEYEVINWGRYGK